MKTYSEWKHKLHPENGLMSSRAQAEFMFNLGKVTRVGIEVGTFKGYSLSIIAAGAASVKHAHDPVFYAIDTFRCSHMTLPTEDTLPIARKALQDVGGDQWVTWVVEDNKTAWRHLPCSLKADWVFIDADHACDPTVQNCRDYSRFVKRGGLVMFHDHDPKRFPEVVRAIGMCVKQGMIAPLTWWDDFFVGERL